MQAGSDTQRLLELRREIWSRRCRRSLTAFATEALAGKGEAPAHHHRRICSELEAGVAAQVNIGAVSMLRAPWNAALVDELGAFPLGRYDDIVDALSLAFSKLSGPGPIRISAEALAASRWRMPRPPRAFV